MRTFIPAPADPGATGSAVIYDSGAVNASGSSNKSASTQSKRVRVVFYTNVADAVFKVDWAAPGSSNLRSFSSETVGAAAVFERDVLLLPGRTKIYISTTTDPTTWELAAELIEDQALAQ